MQNIPEIWQEEQTWHERREQILKILNEEEYGFLPEAPVELSWETTETDREFNAGKAPLRKLLLHITLANGNKFSLPVSTVIPEVIGPVPFFVYISFGAGVPDKYLPSEEIADNGFGMISFYYEDVTPDNDNFNIGLPEALGYKNNNTCGKIALWAWAAIRVMDYAQSLTELDKTRAAIAGHSRLGKTALLAGAIDTRFSYVISNNSGCCGAAISRRKKGETIRCITDTFPYWFRSNFKKYADNENLMPFDQHFLLAASAPRSVYVSSASDDEWADPQAEFLSCKLAGRIWTSLGLKGFICDSESNKLYHGGQVAYHLRNGSHYLSREDWLLFMKFINKEKEVYQA
jgi:hypothetical protein